jgi:aspartate-semialdehyde dehydrogenase
VTTLKRWRVAVLGATGLAGEAMVRALEARAFPAAELYPLATDRSIGRRVAFHGRQLPVLDVASFDFASADIALFAAGAEASRRYAARAVAAGCVVVDDSPTFRGDEDVPLVVPEVNPLAIGAHRARGIVASPSGGAVQLLLALKPLYDAVGLERVNVATYQSVSGAGPAAIEELATQSADLLGGKGPVKPRVVASRIAFNVVPQVQGLLESGHTQEEIALDRETRRVLGDDSLRVNTTAVRVPVFFGDAQVVHLETRRKLTAVEARALLARAPGVRVVDERVDGGYPTPAIEAAEDDRVFVGRIREDLSHERGLDLWVVADPIRRGAAANSVQIVEILVRDYL